MARNTASADSPPPPISPSPTMPLSVSTSTMVRTNRPQWQPLAWRRGAASGTVTVVARISDIRIFCFMVQQSAKCGRTEAVFRSARATWQGEGTFLTQRRRDAEKRRFELQGCGKVEAVRRDMRLRAEGAES